MDIDSYDIILERLKDFNEKSEQNFGNEIVEYPTTNTTFPYTIFEEVRNVQNPRFKSPYDRVASVGYIVRIYAKNQGDYDKKTIARRCAKIVDDYLTSIGLTRTSFNVNDLVNEGSIYEIIELYSGNLHEFRKKFI